MALNRNKVFMIGLIILGLGIQLRAVESFELNEQATQALAKHMRKHEVAAANVLPSLYSSVMPTRKRITPPEWIGWAMLSVGGVLVLQSFAMQKPDG